MASIHPNYPGYIPIIKWQRWEQKALSNIDEFKGRVLPCLEVRDSGQHSNIMNAFPDVWGAEALVDYANPHGHLTVSRRRQLRDLLARDFPVIPVVNPSDLNALQDTNLLNSLRRAGEVALRLRVDGINVDVAQIKQVASALGTLSRHCEVRCLIVDGGVTPGAWDDAELKRFVLNMRSLGSFSIQSLYYASGSFPDGFAKITGTARLPRLDWRLWREISHVAPDLHIGYSDYGTLSPEWTEEVLTRYSRRVAIRYTTDDEWIIVRGSEKTKAESVVISGLFVRLFSGEFKGPAFSYGDELIAERADPSVPLKDKKCGNYHITEAWAHHMAFVVKEQY